MERLDGRVVVITGAASGIGRALASRFASEGCRLVISDVEAGPLSVAADELRADGALVLDVVTDVSDAVSVDELAAAAVDEFGAVHVLCSNAGVSWRSRIDETSLNDWQWVLDVNVWGYINCLQSFLPILTAQDEAHVLVTSSITGLAPGPFSSVYAASKAAINAISEVLHKELRLAGHPVGVTVACPSGVRTNISTSKRNRPDDLPPISTTEPRELVATLFENFPRVRETVELMVTADEFADEMVDAVLAGRYWVLPHEQIDDDLRVRAEDMIADLPPRPGPGG